MILLIIFFTTFFLIGLGTILYSYLVYPVILFLKSDDSPTFLPPIAMDGLPPVSFIIIASDDDAENIKEKLQNTLELDYPADKMEIIVAPDGVDKSIDDVVKTFEKQGVKLARPPRPLGRTLATNFAVRQAAGDILVLSDANGLFIFSPDAVQILVKSLSRPFVGVSSGRVIYDYAETGPSKKIMHIYQKIIHAQQSRESDFGTLTMASNAIHAIRRTDYHPIEKEICPGLALPFEAACDGKRTVYEPKALCLKKGASDFHTDFENQERNAISAAAFTKLFFQNIKRVRLNDFVFSFISGRVIRWLTPYILVMMLVSTLFMSIFSTFFRVMLVFGLVVVLTGLVLSVLRSFGKKLRGTELFLFSGTVFWAFLSGFYRYFIEKSGPRTGI